MRASIVPITPQASEAGTTTIHRRTVMTKR